jgi:hypothetical protein
VRSTVGISLLGSGSLNVANNLLDLLKGLATTDLRPRSEGAGVVLLLLLEAGCICDIQQLEITHIFNNCTQLNDTYTNSSIYMSPFVP